MTKLLALLRNLDEQKVYYTLGHHRDDTVMVKVSVPDEHWEIEFFEDDSVEIEIFRSVGMFEESEIERLLRENDESS